MILILIFGCSYNKKSDILQKNKEIATKYHDLNPADIDSILTDNFIGRQGNNLFTWNRDDHRKYLSNGSYKKDSIFNQIAEGDWVATRFVRTGDYNGDTVKVEIMHFKRFENGKIAEIWEYPDYRMVKEIYDKAEAKEIK
jgi:predicted SnoaL-like aldol condensation-catalyzing enzyme